MDCTTDRNRSSLARSASSARVRSAVTAASTSAVSAAVARNSWLERRLSVIDSRTNGPALCAVFQTVSDETTTSAVAAPRGPKRSAAQMSTGKTTYGTSRCDGSSASSTRAVSTAAPSSRSQRESPRTPRVAQVRISGVTTSAPEKSESHHVRQTSANWSAGMTSPRRSDVAPKLALIRAPAAAAATSANTSPTRSRPVRLPIRRRRRTAATRISSVLPSV